MRVPATLIGLAWLVFVVVWVVSMFFAKRAAYRAPGFWVVRAVVIVLMVIAIRQQARGGAWSAAPTGHPAAAVVGVVLCLAGIAFAFWARWSIGRNWGMPMSRKANPELVTAGPYRYVRHPIYSGVLVAMLGTALVMGLPWLVLLVLMGGYFAWSARSEEKYLVAEFPEAYPAYRARTRMLIPFVV